MNKPTWYDELSQINISGKIEKKNGLSYLPWMDAWSALKRHYPLSYSIVHESPEGLLIWRDPIGAHVKTSVILVYFDEDGNKCEQCETEYLPVFDYKNKVVPYENIDAMMVNKTIQRSMTKCIARLGLGESVFRGEDLPEELDAVKELAAKVDATIKLKTSSMSVDDKRAYAMNIIVPIIGTANYKTCKDPVLLQALYDKINEN